MNMLEKLGLILFIMGTVFRIDNKNSYSENIVWMFVIILGVAIFLLSGVK